MFHPVESVCGEEVLHEVIHGERIETGKNRAVDGTAGWGVVDWLIGCVPRWGLRGTAERTTCRSGHRWLMNVFDHGWSWCLMLETGDTMGWRQVPVSRSWNNFLRVSASCRRWSNGGAGRKESATKVLDARSHVEIQPVALVLRLSLSWLKLPTCRLDTLLSIGTSVKWSTAGRGRHGPSLVPTAARAGTDNQRLPARSPL